MITKQEAAERLSISRSRVLDLIKTGQLRAEKISGVWFIDESSVDTRVRTTSKKGGRPKRGKGKDEVRFTLMNRTHEIAEVVYDEGKREFTFIGELLDAKRAPLGIKGHSGEIHLANFNDWWKNRGIPRTRNGLDRLLLEAGARMPEELLYRNLGLSLSDQYWINPAKSGITWEDVNFFDNDFEQVDATTQSLPNAKNGLHAHPDNTSDGNLAKEWIIRDGIRFLRKGGLRRDQEPFNEVVATALHRRLLRPEEFVTYQLDAQGPSPACLCPNFLTDKEEYVPAIYVMREFEQDALTSDFDHYLECCDRLGVRDARAVLERLIVCDDIIANTDRHFRNFGIIRNTETLECRPAPIFDSGTSLWCESDLATLAEGDFSFTSKQFEASPARQMLLVEDLSWFDISKVEGFVDEAMGILAKNDQMEKRLPYIQRALEWRVERMGNLVEWS